MVAGVALLVASGLLVACGGASTNKATALVLQPAPTVISEYGQDLAIDDDGLLYVKYADDTRTNMTVTLAMIDQTGFNKNSIAEQTLNVVYEGLKAPFSFTLNRDVASISIKTAPTVTSTAGYLLAIANDGLLSVAFEDGGTSDVAITMDMLDLTGFDPNFEEEQSVMVVYGGLTTSFAVTLVRDPAEDNKGTASTTRLEAEFAQDYGGSGWVGVEDCGTQKRTDGSQEQCIKGMFQVEAGGYLEFVIDSSKTTTATAKISLSKQINFAGDYDEYTRFLVNDIDVLTGIHTDPGNENNGWWDFVTYDIASTLHLREGENTIRLLCNGAAGKKTTTSGGVNINWLDITTTGDLSWEPNIPVVA